MIGHLFLVVLGLLAATFIAGNGINNAHKSEEGRLVVPMKKLSDHEFVSRIQSRIAAGRR